MANIVSPLPGIFYTAAGPDKDPFVTPGDHIEANQIVGLIEVMKQFTEIRSDVSGAVDSVKVADNTTVTPGTVLVTVTED